MNFQSAVKFVRERGGPVDLARLAYLLDKQPAGPSITSQLLALQRPDGGWEPFWAAGYSSLDATCFRLAQAESLGVGAAHPAIACAIQFLVHRQRPDGAWEESFSVVDQAPLWAKPGSLQARLYLTACCGFWVAVSGIDQSCEVNAAGYLQPYLTPEGRLPSFLHACWLACGLFYRLQRIENASMVLDYLASRLQELESSNLAWLLTTLLVAGYDPGESFLQTAGDRLEEFQAGDGSWPGEDGPDHDLHTTLESMRVLRWLGR